MSRNVKDLYNEWLEKATDSAIAEELKNIANNEEAINDAFYRDLAFGTGGLRGVIGAGTNRMNIYTVAKATQGFSNYINATSTKDVKSVAIGYDSRINSDIFSRTAAAVFAANGIKVYIYPELMPTPAVSFAIRTLDCDAGVMITASHNPAKYNGYKAYGADGCQVKTQVASDISDAFNALDIFADIKEHDFESSLEAGQIEYISEEIYTQYIEAVKSLSLLDENTEINKDVKIIYSPINGTGLKPVLRILNELGYTNVSVVKEQEEPDGRFPTTPRPNPEFPETMELGIQYAKCENADMVMATDPDADRLGIAIKNPDGEFELVSGNLVGVLFLEYIIERRKAMNKLPENAVLVKTIVTTSLADRIAKENGIKVENVLTGFKYIGDKIGQLEAEGRVDDYILGFEESYGYLSSSHVRDKDAVNAAFLAAEMFSYYMTKGVNLFDKLEQIYEKYGFTYDKMQSYKFEGETGFKKMNSIMEAIRKPVTELAGFELSKVLDYNKGVGDLPLSDVMQFFLGDKGSVVVRPSGTEPLIKVYVSVKVEREMAEEITAKIFEAIEDFAGIND